MTGPDQYEEPSKIAALVVYIGVRSGALAYNGHETIESAEKDLKRFIKSGIEAILIKRDDFTWEQA